MINLNKQLYSLADDSTDRYSANKYPLGGKVDSQLYNDLKDQVEKEVNNRLGEQIYRQLWTQLFRQLSGHLEEVSYND